MADEKDKAEFYHEQAKYGQERAEKTRDPEARRSWLEIASRYEELAKALERNR